MQKNDLYFKENSIVRVLEVREDNALVIDCIQRMMSIAIESVAADIYSGAADNLGKPEKVTGKNICKILGIKEHRLENMPESRAVLDKYAESYPEAWARKLVWAYKWLKNNEEDVFYWKHLRKLTGVKKTRFDEVAPYLKKYADEDEVKSIVTIIKGI